MSEASAGRLFLCATPIGNLEDVSTRLLTVLRDADLIAAEDTRQTRKLLARFEIHTPLVSYHQHNQEFRGGFIVQELISGKNVALVSDAGMPGISDPGEELVCEAIRSGIAVIPIPGPVAAVTALAASGLPTARFAFEGFLPRQKRARKAALEKLSGDDRTLVFYESPHRLAEMLDDLLTGLGDRRIVLARELTKLHEEFWRGTVSAAIAHVEGRGARGEYTVVVEGCIRNNEPSQIPDDSPISERVSALAAGGLSEMDALKRLARETGRAKSDLYRQLMNERAAQSENHNPNN